MAPLALAAEDFWRYQGLLFPLRPARLTCRGGHPCGVPGACLRGPAVPAVVSRAARYLPAKQAWPPGPRRRWGTPCPGRCSSSPARFHLAYLPRAAIAHRQQVAEPRPVRARPLLPM